jgi:manganese/zinc/iron transport system permease protein
VLPGIVIGFLISAHFGSASLHSPWILIGATVVGMAAALLVQTVQEHSRVKEDASLGIVFTTLFAFGVVMINLYAGQTDLDPGCVLYGDLADFIIKPGGIWPMSVITAGILLGIVVFYRHLLISTFDPALAVSLGIPARGVHYALMAVLSLSIVASFEAVGAILAVALLVTPGATARLWTDRMPRMLVLAGVHGVASTAIGYWLSHPVVLNTAASGAICVAGFGLFLLSWLLAPRHGLLSRWRIRRRLSGNMAIENLLKTLDELGRARGNGDGAGAATAGVPKPDLAGELRVPPRELARTLARAVARGWVTRQDGGGRLTLTPSGRTQSMRLVRAHELWERYLRKEVGLNDDHVHEAAEWIEHYLSEEKMAHLDELLAEDAAGGKARGPA